MLTPDTVLFLGRLAETCRPPYDDDASVDPADARLASLVTELLFERVAPRQGNGVAHVCATAHEVGGQQAEGDRSLERVLHAVRAAGRQLWDDLVAEANPAVDLRDLGVLLWEVVDQVCEHVARGFHAWTQIRSRPDEQSRIELWEGLLHGMAAEPAFAREALRALGLFGPRYVAIQVEDGTPLAVDEACLAASWLQRPTVAHGLVALEPDGLPALVDRLGEVADRPVGVSSVIAEPGRVERALVQAGQAVRTRMGTPGVAAFDHALPETLLQGSPEITEHLLLTWLGPLLELPASERGELLATLRAWVDAGCSPTAAASALYCHRNTVLNRMRRITAVLGRELPVPPPLELALALRAVAGLHAR